MDYSDRPCPRAALWLLKIFLHGEDRMEMLDDLEQIFRFDLQEKGRIRASLIHWGRVCRVLFSRFELVCYWRFAMFRNHIIIAWRNLISHKGYAVINILGLALGLAVFLVIVLWVRHELNFDRFHTHAGDIYRVAEHRRFPDQVRTSYRTPGPLAEVLRRDFPELQYTTRVAMTGERVLRYQDQVHYEREILTVDPEFLSLFTFPFVTGSPMSALQSPSSIVLTESAAEKYFGSQDPLGKVLNLDNRFDFTVTGVVRDAPSHSHLQFDMLVPFDVVEKLGWKTDVWDFSMSLTYIRVIPGTEFSVLESKLAGLVRAHDPDSNVDLFLQRLTRIRLFTNFDDPNAAGRIQYIAIFSLLGVLILGMAFINFMNLTTARAQTRCKEIGMRKVAGAGRSQIVRQFLSESVFLAFLALAVSPLFVQMLLPVINRLTEKTFSLADFADLPLLGLVVALTFLTGLISGSYPAVYLSTLRPSQALKAGALNPKRGALLRKGLVVLQMCISLGLVIISVVIHMQVRFLKNKDLGFNQEHVLSVPLGISNTENPKLYERFKDELKTNPHAKAVSGAFTHPTMLGTQAQDVVHRGRRLDQGMPINLTSVTYDFVETLQIELIRGRSFSRDYGAEKGNLIVNQSLERLLGMESSLGQTLNIGEEYQGQIVGVLKDFHMEAVSSRMIGPLILFLNPAVNYILIGMNPGDTAEALASLQASWEKVAPHLPFTYTFLDEDFDRLYQDIENLGTVLRYLTFLAGAIACLGLLGLASFSAQKRTKEIGVRKVLGASEKEIISLLCGDYLKLVLAAHFFAWPVSWWLMYRWLQDFPYRTALSFWIFLLAGAAVLAATLLTVSVQTIKAALNDPVDSLRYE